MATPPHRNELYLVHPNLSIQNSNTIKAWLQPHDSRWRPRPHVETAAPARRDGPATFHDSRRRPRPARIPCRATFLVMAGPRRPRPAHDPTKRIPARLGHGSLSLSLRSGDRLSTLEWRNAAAPHHPAHRRRALLRIDYK